MKRCDAREELTVPPKKITGIEALLLQSLFLVCGIKVNMQMVLFKIQRVLALDIGAVPCHISSEFSVLFVEWVMIVQNEGIKGQHRNKDSCCAKEKLQMIGHTDVVVVAYTAELFGSGNKNIGNLTQNNIRSAQKRSVRNF